MPGAFPGVMVSERETSFSKALERIGRTLVEEIKVTALRADHLAHSPATRRRIRCAR